MPLGRWVLDGAPIYLRIGPMDGRPAAGVAARANGLRALQCLVEYVEVPEYMHRVDCFNIFKIDIS